MIASDDRVASATSGTLDESTGSSIGGFPETGGCPETKVQDVVPTVMSGIQSAAKPTIGGGVVGLTQGQGLPVGRAAGEQADRRLAETPLHRDYTFEQFIKLTVSQYDPDPVDRATIRHMVERDGGTTT